MIPRAILDDVMMDLAGMGLVVVTMWWGHRVTRAAGGDPSALIRFGGAVVATYLIVRTVRQASVCAPPVAILVAVALLSMWPVAAAGTPRTGEAFGALSYANASAALYLLAAVSGLVLTRTAQSRTGRDLATVAVVAVVVAVLASGSVAAIVLLALPAIAFRVRDPRSARILLALGGAVLLTAVASTWWIADRFEPADDGSRERVVVRALSPERLSYWSEALDLAAEHPVTGVGAGRFRDLAPSARGNVDAVAVHNEYLQAAAELGVVGLFLLLALMGWGFVRLAVSAHDPAAALAGAGLAALGVQASIDYVLHAPAVVLVLVALLATGAGRLGGPPTREVIAETRLSAA